MTTCGCSSYAASSRATDNKQKPSESHCLKALRLYISLPAIPPYGSTAHAALEPNEAKLFAQHPAHKMACNE